MRRGNSAGTQLLDDAQDVRLVNSRTFAPPLITRETVPTPTPDAAATSAMVTRPEGAI